MTEKPPPLRIEEKAVEECVAALKPLRRPDALRILQEAIADVQARPSRPPVGTTKINGQPVVEWLDVAGKLHTGADQLADLLRRASPDELRNAREQLKAQGVDLDARIAGTDSWVDLLKQSRDSLAGSVASALNRAAPPPALPGFAESRFPPNVPRSLAGLRDSAIATWATHEGNPDAFVWRWYRLGFPTFELTGSLAAALCMTECRGLRGRDYRLPFAAFAIQMPSPSPLVLPAGDVRFMLVDGRGDVLAFAGDGDSGANPVIRDPGDDELLDDWIRQNVWPGMARFAVNLCVYISSLHALPPPEGRRKPGTHGGARKRDHELLPPQRWVLGRQIKLSNGMMQAARASTSPATTAKARAEYRMHARFMVRGHWRNQACGKKHAERRMKWIEPFWKGPEMAEGLARLYAIAGEPKA